MTTLLLILNVYLAVRVIGGDIHGPLADYLRHRWWPRCPHHPKSRHYEVGLREGDRGEIDAFCEECGTEWPLERSRWWPHLWRPFVPDRR